MITQVLYGRYAYNPKNDDRCPWGLVWNTNNVDHVRCCQKKRGHRGAHSAMFDEAGMYVRIEWSYVPSVRDYFKTADEDAIPCGGECCEGAD